MFNSLWMSLQKIVIQVEVFHEYFDAARIIQKRIVLTSVVLEMAKTNLFSEI